MQSLMPAGVRAWLHCASWASPCSWVSVGELGDTWALCPAGDVAPTAPMSPVNYRGSLGFGQASITSLLSRVGEQDVADTQVRGAGLGVLDGVLPRGSDVGVLMCGCPTGAAGSGAGAA